VRVSLCSRGQLQEGVEAGACEARWRLGRPTTRCSPGVCVWTLSWRRPGCACVARPRAACVARRAGLASGPWAQNADAHRRVRAYAANMYRTVLGAADDIVMGYSSVSSMPVLKTGDAHPVFVSLPKTTAPVLQCWARRGASRRQTDAVAAGAPHAKCSPLRARCRAARVRHARGEHTFPPLPTLLSPSPGAGNSNPRGSTCSNSTGRADTCRPPSMCFGRRW